MYDEVKQNDLTIYSEEGYDNESLKELVFSNLKRFDGNVKAFVYDQKNKKKTSAAFFPMETVNYVKSLSKKKVGQLILPRPSLARNNVRGYPQV